MAGGSQHLLESGGSGDCIMEYGPACHVDRGDSGWSDLGEAIAEATGIAALVDCAAEPSLSSCTLAALGATPFGKAIVAGRVGGRVARAVAGAHEAGKRTAVLIGGHKGANATFQSLVAKLLPGAKIKKKAPGVWVATNGDQTIRLRAPVRSTTVQSGKQPKGTWTIDLGGFGLSGNKQDNFKIFFRRGS